MSSFGIAVWSNFSIRLRVSAPWPWNGKSCLFREGVGGAALSFSSCDRSLWAATRCGERETAEAGIGRKKSIFGTPGGNKGGAAAIAPRGVPLNVSTPITLAPWGFWGADSKGGSYWQPPFILPSMHDSPSMHDFSFPRCGIIKNYTAFWLLKSLKCPACGSFWLTG